MILTAHQPVYLPWLGLFDKIAQANTFVLFDDVQYCPKDYQNRNLIYTAHGPQWLTVPVLHARDTKIKEVRINNALPWQRKHFKTICQSYQKAQYFDRYLPTLEMIYERPWTHLSDLNDFILLWCLGELGISVNYLYASDYAFLGSKSELVLNMCKALGATTYIFGSQGREYADVKAFESAGIEVRFQHYSHPTYAQFDGPFASHLSVLDLLMHHGPESMDILRNHMALETT